MAAEIMAEEATKTCPVCGKRMIKRDTGTALASMPPQYGWNWWCGCGHTETGGTRRGMTGEEIARAQWEAAQEKRARAAFAERFAQEDEGIKMADTNDYPLSDGMRAMVAESAERSATPPGIPDAPATPVLDLPDGVDPDRFVRLYVTEKGILQHTVLPPNWSKGDLCALLFNAALAYGLDLLKVAGELEREKAAREASDGR